MPHSLGNAAPSEVLEAARIEANGITADALVSLINVAQQIPTTALGEALHQAAQQAVLQCSLETVKEVLDWAAAVDAPEWLKPAAAYRRARTHDERVDALRGSVNYVRTLLYRMFAGDDFARALRDVVQESDEA